MRICVFPKTDPTHVIYRVGPQCGCCNEQHPIDQQRCTQCRDEHGCRIGQPCPGLGRACAYRDRLELEAFELPDGRLVCAGCASDATGCDDDLREIAAPIEPDSNWTLGLRRAAP